jgi:hypothetical protein
MCLETPIAIRVPIRPSLPWFGTTVHTIKFSGRLRTLPDEDIYLVECANDHRHVAAHIQIK